MPSLGCLIALPMCHAASSPAYLLMLYFSVLIDLDSRREQLWGAHTACTDQEQQSNVSKERSCSVLAFFSAQTLAFPGSSSLFIQPHTHWQISEPWKQCNAPTKHGLALFNLYFKNNHKSHVFISCANDSPCELTPKPPWHAMFILYGKRMLGILKTWSHIESYIDNIDLI